MQRPGGEKASPFRAIGDFFVGGGAKAIFPGLIGGGLLGFAAFQVEQLATSAIRIADTGTWGFAVGWIGLIGAIVSGFAVSDIVKGISYANREGQYRRGRHFDEF